LVLQPAPMALVQRLDPLLSPLFDAVSFPEERVAELRGLAHEGTLVYVMRSAGALNYASIGIGSAPHLAAELFKSVAKVDLTHVPYKGSSAQAITALIAVLPARVISVGVGKEPSALPRKTVAVALPEVAGLLIEIRSPLPSMRRSYSRPPWSLRAPRSSW